MAEHAVLVVGAGPAGMMVAAELSLADVDVAIIERRPTAELIGSRAGGFHSRTLEILDQRGIVDRFLAEGQTAQAAMFGSLVLDMSDFPTRHPYSLGLWQNHIERIMAGWIDELGIPVYREREVVGLAQQETSVELQLADGETWHASYVVGADGGRSLIRKLAGIGFEGLDATMSHLIAEVEMTAEIPQGTRMDETGVHGMTRLENGHTVRVITTERRLGPATEPTLDDLSANLIAVYGTDFGVHDPTWVSRFTDATRQATAYRAGRVMLVGDAAHIHHPSGGQGIGLGVQDSVNLGWKLAQVVRGVSPESLLDTYHSERHPADARGLEHTMASSVLQRPDPRVVALRGIVDGLLTVDGARKQIAGRISGLDVHYDLGEGHPMLGRRMPDLDLATSDGPVRVFELLHDARPLLISFGASVDIPQWSDRVRSIQATYDGAWELPVIGEVPAPTAVLVRPDGHVAWVGEDSEEGLTDALTRWCGEPTSAVTPR